MSVAGPQLAPRYGRAAALALAAALIGPAVAADAATAVGPAFVTVQAQPVARALSAYAQVEPIALVRVRAAQAGTLHGLSVVPGSVVHRGEELARLGGPRMRARLTALAQALQAARARDDAARRTLRSVRQRFDAQLADRAELDAAQGDASAAHAAARVAAARWRAARELRSVRAPAAGVVVALRAADGEQVGGGQTVVVLQPAARLWLRASCYGADAAALHVGMHGRFQPAQGGGAIAVKVAAIGPAVAADGGVPIGLLPAGGGAPPRWISGQWGRLTVSEPTRPMVMVPTSALILDRGRWWVLLHTPRGDTPQAVVPGPARGWQTAIDAGLRPGQQVVVTDAFLEFHRGIARAYTPPD